jgi:hypothetical protein
MKQLQSKTFTKAAQCAELLVSDLREAHKHACNNDPALELLLRDLIGDAMKVKNRLGELESCCIEIQHSSNLTPAQS